MGSLEKLKFKEVRIFKMSPITWESDSRGVTYTIEGKKRKGIMPVICLDVSESVPVGIIAGRIHLPRDPQKPDAPRKGKLLLMEAWTPAKLERLGALKWVKSKLSPNARQTVLVIPRPSLRDDEKCSDCQLLKDQLKCTIVKRTKYLRGDSILNALSLADDRDELLTKFFPEASRLDREISALEQDSSQRAPIARCVERIYDQAFHSIPEWIYADL